MLRRFLKGLISQFSPDLKKKSFWSFIIHCIQRQDSPPCKQYVIHQKFLGSRFEDVAQLVECSPSMHQNLDSILGTEIKLGV